MRLIDADFFQQQVAAIAIMNNLPADKCNALCELIEDILLRRKVLEVRITLTI